MVDHRPAQYLALTVSCTIKQHSLGRFCSNVRLRRLAEELACEEFAHRILDVLIEGCVGFARARFGELSTARACVIPGGYASEEFPVVGFCVLDEETLLKA